MLADFLTKQMKTIESQQFGEINNSMKKRANIG